MLLPSSRSSQQYTCTNMLIPYVEVHNKYKCTIMLLPSSRSTQQYT